MNADEAKKLSVDELIGKLSSNKGGLTSQEAQKRLLEFGPNAILEKKINPILKFFTYFWGPIPWMIEIAAILSASVHHWEDFWIIMTMLLINAGVGFWQEYKADNAIELLKKKLALKARVKRDGKWILLAAEGIVPGDLVRVRLGEIIPADIKLMIAYDNTNIYQDPVSWNMRRVLSLATVLGIMGVFASFLMFWIGERVLHLDRVTIQTLIFLKLTVVGHMTIYLARIGEELFWIRPYPSPALFWTAETTQVIATFFVVYGIFMKPIGWNLAGFVWI